LGCRRDVPADRGRRGRGHRGRTAPCRYRRRFQTGESCVREVAVQAPDLPALLVAWLRELLYLYEAEKLAYRGGEFQKLEPDGLRARIRCEVVDRAAREIKGVTYHGLE